jgi:hypothetical protein
LRLLLVSFFHGDDDFADNGWHLDDPWGMAAR